MSSPSRALSLVVGCFVAAAAVPALAQPSPRFREEAKRRNKIATQMYQNGQFETALQQYQSAYDLYPDPAFLFNIGLAREKTFDYEGCAVAFEKFLREAKASAADVRTQAEQRSASCLERALIPVKVTSVPTNAAVYLGEPSTQTLKGRTPQELKLGIGPTHRITVEHPGHVPQTQSLTLRPGDRPQLDFVLEKLSVITIEADPAGASVRVDGGDLLQAPATVEVTAGPHVVEVTKQGYDPQRKEVRVRAGQDASLMVPLRQARIERWLELRIADKVALTEVKVDNRSAGASPAGAPPLRVKVEPGTRRVAIKADGRIPFASDIVVPEERDLRMLVNLTPTRTRRNRIVTWSLGGAAALTGLTGATFGVLSYLDQRQLEDDPSVPLSERGHERAVLADRLLLTAGIFVACAVTYYFVTSPRASTVTEEK